jgi:RNA polymerase sigma-70 factor (ECF subfamily)
LDYLTLVDQVLFFRKTKIPKRNTLFILKSVMPVSYIGRMSFCGWLTKMLEDKVLVRRFKSGDEAALERIYEKYKNELLALAVSLTNDTTAAEDAVHDVFVSLARSAARPYRIKNLKKYLMTSVANRVRNQQRYKQRHQTVGMESSDIPGRDLSRPERWLVLNEELELLDKALAQIPYEQREVITLYMQGNMSLREIAKFQNESSNTVAGRYRYGIKKLRSLLNGDMGK